VNAHGNKACDFQPTDQTHYAVSEEIANTRL